MKLHEICGIYDIRQGGTKKVWCEKDKLYVLTEDYVVETTTGFQPVTFTNTYTGTGRTGVLAHFLSKHGDYINFRPSTDLCFDEITEQNIISISNWLSNASNN